MKYIIIYDFEGRIVSQYGGTNVTPPVGIPYLILEDYSFNFNDENYRPIVSVDVTKDPNEPVYGSTKKESELESMTLDELKEYRQTENKTALAKFLKENPLLWTDGCYYGITQEDQDEMIADKTAYDFKKALGDTSWKLQWHSVKSACRDFTEEEFAGLLNTIVDFVYPYRQLEMQYKKQIYDAETKEEVFAVSLSYALPESSGASSDDDSEDTESVETT